MSADWEKMAEYAAEAAEIAAIDRQRRIDEGDWLDAEGSPLFPLEEVPLDWIGFTPSGPGYQVQEQLALWYPRGKTPWTRLLCGLGGRWHDNGVEMRLERSREHLENPRAWRIKVREGRRHGDYGRVYMVQPEREDDAQNPPARWHITCRGCGKPTRRNPMFLDDALMAALLEYRSRATVDGGRPAHDWPPQVRWTADTNTSRSSIR